jgi:ubiquitin carboxyl-terminal hydrolase 34
MSLDDDVQVSVEETTEVDMTNSDTPDQVILSSRSETSSPAVEIITIDEDDDVDDGSGQPQVTLLHGVQDPTGDFPFQEASETVLDTVSRLAGFMVARTFSSLCEEQTHPLTISCT